MRSERALPYGANFLTKGAPLPASTLLGRS